MAIDVFFTGLMLICLKGSECTGIYDPYYDNVPNTAWVVKADGQSKPCGWDSKEETELVLSFTTVDFYQPDNLYCAQAGNYTTCLLPEVEDICVFPIDYRKEETVYNDLDWLPQIDQVDRRFKALRMDRLKNSHYVPTRIHFPDGDVIAPGPEWPDTEGIHPPTWYRSNGDDYGPLPSKLSDRLMVTYKGIESIWLARCPTNQRPEIPLVELRLIDNPNPYPEIEFQNRTKRDPIPDYVAEYDDLAYLLWYYRLGSWASTLFGTCPKYTSANRNAVLLRCVRQMPNKSCAHVPNAKRVNTFWPPMLAPGCNGDSQPCEE